MLLALVLASSCLTNMEVAPEAGAVPSGGSLWAISAPFGIAVEDAEGRTLRLISNPAGRALEFSVDFPVGTEFYVRRIGEGDAYGEKWPHFGPWRVVAKKEQPVRPAPVISAAKALESNGFPVARGWELASTVEAPLYEYAFTGAKKSDITWDARLWVGSGRCRASTWSWSDGAVNVRIRAHFADGSVSGWSNPLALAVPTHQEASP